MKKALVVILAVVAVAAVSGCGRNPCRKLTAQICEKVEGTPACEAAGRLTAADECEDYLVNMDKFIEIKNSTVTTEGVKPPATEPAPAPAPAAGTEAPATGADAPAPEAQPAAAPATTP